MKLKNARDSSLKWAATAIGRLEWLEQVLEGEGVTVPSEGGASARGLLIQATPYAPARPIALHAYTVHKAAQHVVHTVCPQLTTDKKKCARWMSHVPLAGCVEQPAIVSCPHKYYSTDGTCNSLSRSNRGRSYTGYRRLLAPEYADGLGEPRSVSRSVGGPLPSPRQVSIALTAVTPPPQHTATVRSLMLAYWTMFVAQDLAHTPHNAMRTYT